MHKSKCKSQPAAGAKRNISPPVRYFQNSEKLWYLYLQVMTNPRTFAALWGAWARYYRRRPFLLRMDGNFRGEERGNNREEMKVNYRYVNCDAPCWSTGTGPQGYYMGEYHGEREMRRTWTRWRWQWAIWEQEEKPPSSREHKFTISLFLSPRRKWEGKNDHCKTWYTLQTPLTEQKMRNLKDEANLNLTY